MIAIFGKTHAKSWDILLSPVKKGTTFLRTITYKVKTSTFRNHQFDPHRKLRACEQ
jgi:hypothetical protein